MRTGGDLMFKKFVSLFIATVIVFGSFSVSSVFADSVSENKDASADLDSENKNASKMVAFPGAEGGGMYATGVRGAIQNGEKMEVYHVTSLADSGAGSFRDAVSKGNRIIVFDKAGYIDLNSNVNIGGKGGNITILGQTAPGDGVCFRGNNIKVSGENIILRYLRFRVGDKLSNGSYTKAQDGLEIVDDTKNVIVDHCSVSWGTDENFSAYAVKDVTIQNSIIAEALNQSVHAKGEHSYAAIWGGVNLTVHHNLIATHKSRNPKIGTSETTAMTAGYTDADTVVDIRNNVFYNWGDKAGYGAENKAQVNIINNYYKAGPATPINKRARIFEYSVGQKFETDLSGRIWADGNKIDSYITDEERKSTDPKVQEAVKQAEEDARLVNENNFQIERGTGVYLDPKYPDMKYEKLANPVETYIKDYPIAEDTADNAYKKVIADVGANLPKQDLVDARIIRDVTNRTAPQTGSNRSEYLVDSPIDGIQDETEENKANYDDRGYPKFDEVSRDAAFDSDMDGIPDEWEDKMGLDKTNPNDSLNIAPGGYTWLEIYTEDLIRTKNEDGVITITPDKNAVSQSDSVNLTVDYKTLTPDSFEVYCDGERIRDNVTVSNSVTLDNLPLGENYITVKAINSDGSYALSKTAVVYVYGAAYSGDFENTSDGTGAVVSEDGGKYYMYTDGAKKAAVSKKNIAGDFVFAADIGYISNLLNDVQTGVSITSGSNSFELYKTYKDGKEAWEIGKSGLAGDISKLDAFKDNMIRIKKTGNTLTVQSGSSAAMLKDVLSSDAFTGNVTVEVYTKGAEGKKTVSEFENISYISNDQVSSPKISITNIENNQRLDFNTTINVNVTKDNNVEITEIAVFLNNKVVEDVFYENGIPSNPVEIPVRFSDAENGELRVVCFDKNLGMGEDKRNVSVSSDIKPWEITNVGCDSNDMSSYVQFIQYNANVNGPSDYTYKIGAPEGYISGTSDKYGYMYQKFNNDMRVYYRARVNSEKYFGLMLKNDIAPNSVSYYFGYDPDSKCYVLKERTEANGEYNVLKTIPQTTAIKRGDAPIIAEKAGSKLRFYLTSPKQASADFYKSKTLLAEVDTSLGNEYYMGFAATKEDPKQWLSDAIWVAMESIDSSKAESYIWNMDYGLDYNWQIQDSSVLLPDWTTGGAINADTNNTGKMVVSTGSNYKETKNLMREYVINEGVVENGFDVVVAPGENPGISFYLQTEPGYAYSVGFNEDSTVSSGSITLKDGEDDFYYQTLKWYRVKINTEIGGETADIALYEVNSDSTATLVGELKDVPKETFQNVVTAYNDDIQIKQGFFIRPKESSQGTYYLDNMYVSLDPKSALKSVIDEAKTLVEGDYTAKSWENFSGALQNAETVYNNADATVEESLTALNNLKDAMGKLKKKEIAGSETFWRFDETRFTGLGDKIKGTNEVDGLKLTLDSKASFDKGGGPFDDGTSFSQVLKTGGAGSMTSRCFKFNVSGKALIKVYAVSANSSNRVLVITDGTTEKEYTLTGNAGTVAEYEYNGPGAEITVYGKDGLNYYGIKCASIVTLDKEPRIAGYNKTSGIAEIYGGENGVSNAVVGVVVMDDTGKVAEVKKTEIKANDPVEAGDIKEINVGKLSANGKVKVVLWESFDTMKPVCDSFSVGG